MKIQSAFVYGFAVLALSLGVGACGDGRSNLADSAWAFTADPPTEEELALARKCGRPTVAPSKAINIKYQNLAGVDANSQSLDIYMPQIINPCLGVPVVIYVHGGGWRLGDKSHVRYKPEYFNALGYVFVSVNYRLSPLNNQMKPDRIMFPVHPTDVGAAVSWIHKNIKQYGGNSEKLALLGHSAGGHLAALVGTDQSYIQKSYPEWKPEHLRCVGSYDTAGYDIPRLMVDPDPRQRALYRNAFGDDPEIWSLASPINHVRQNGPAFQLVKRGNAERHGQVQSFKNALESKMNSVSVINAQVLSHNDVTKLIGAPGDRRMTPQVTEFMKTKCFPR